MDNPTKWYLVAGTLFTVVGVFQFLVLRLPLTSTILYLLVGLVIGSGKFGLFTLSAVEHASMIERLSEVVVIVSLFTAGLKLRPDQGSRHWRPAYRLASVSMIATVGLIACTAVWGFGFSWGSAVLLGGILAPTDPVLAGEVQIRTPSDGDPLRFTLTGEAGFNDGTAFPFVMLGLGWLGLHEIGPHATRWFLVDVLWQVGGGLATGAILGSLFSRIIVHLRKRKRTVALLEDFLAIGLLCLAYGGALAINTYGFLAVFTAGLSLGRTERRGASLSNKSKAESAKTTEAVLKFNEQVERLAEVGAVILVGALINSTFRLDRDLLFIPLLLFIIRPLAVTLGLWGSHCPKRQRTFIAWFGIRGIGSIYYLHYAISHGVPESISMRLASIVLSTIAVSIVLHGVSVTPLMAFYESRVARLFQRA